MTDENFPLENILTINAELYVASKGKKPEDYNYVGIHPNNRWQVTNMETFQKIVPKGTEVVTNFIPSYATVCGDIVEMRASGTALIPKRL